MNSHYSGRLQRAVDEVFEKAPDKFYEIFNTYDFYNVADTKNGLTPEQRDQVPMQNQYRYTQFSLAIATMIRSVLGGDNGLLSHHVQDIIDKLDAAGAMSLTQLSGVSSGLSAIPGGNAIGASMKALQSQTASAMGINPYHPDLIPPITIGMPGLPAGIGNLYMPGFFQPDWSFLYNFESPNSKFYIGPSGLMIGPGLPITGTKETDLKKIFAVSGADKSLTPTGDLLGGVTPDQFQTIVEASKASEQKPYLTNGFSLNEIQMRNSFNRWVQMSLWDIIKNPTNWANAHWGALANNSCPEPVKTAVCSYIWTQGLAIETKKSDDLALVSYLVTMGVYYLTGYKYNVRVTPIKGLDKESTGTSVSGPDSPNKYHDMTTGVATDETIANTYFTYAADIILRTTNMSADEKLGNELRKRRVAEANLIYKHVGLPELKYGTHVSDLPLEHTVSGLKSRNFQLIANDSFTFYRYNNTGVAGGEGQGTKKGQLLEPTNIYATVSFSKDANPEPMTANGDGCMNFLRSMMDQAGVKSATITSTTRTAVDQCRAMYGNLIKGTEIRYGAGGRAVTQQFYNSKSKPAAECQADMVKVCKAQPEQVVSRHCADFTQRLVLDIGPNSIQPQSARGAFEQLLRAAQADGSVIYKVLTPADNDPAFHIEMNPNSAFTAHPNRKPPDVEFSLTNPSFTKESGWNSPLSIDALNSDSATKV